MNKVLTSFPELSDEVKTIIKHERKQLREATNKLIQIKRK